MIEIVTHCWNYPRLLMYHISSLVRNPPIVPVQLTVFYDLADQPTVDVLDFFSTQMLTPVTLCARPMERERLCRRTCGRHEAAIATKADLVWFADADYWFGPGCLDRLYEVTKDNPGPLFYPRFTLVSKEQCNGDALINDAVGPPRVLDLDPATFTTKKERRAIGGIQIVKGDICREKGYLPPQNFGRYHRPAAIWARTSEDKLFRMYLGTGGIGVQIPSVYRIRHSTRGGLDGVVYL